ncbi:MAG: methanethiol S-methyltransferase [Pseudomonadota bacterium]
MGRLLILVYALICYVVFFATFLYLIGFVEGNVVPRTINGPGPSGDLLPAVLIDLALIAVFGISHSVMAREGFKARWTKIVPRPAERSTYVLVASLALVLLFWQWRPVAGTVWQVEDDIARMVLIGLSLAGWLAVLLATFMIDHFDLFGLRQAWLNFTGRPYTPPQFRETAFYKLVRHPIYFGFLIAFWAIPTMTVGHLVFAAGMTVYILIGVAYEEKDLMRWHGDAYAAYKRRVAGLIPGLKLGRR